MHRTALQPVAPDTARARLAALELEVAQRESEIGAIKRELQALQSQYLEKIGSLYARLYEIEDAIAAAEITMGLRPPPPSEDDAGEAQEAAGADPDTLGIEAGCSQRSGPSADLKRIFRQLAKSIHPDLARDGAARYRRHSLMAEANRAYAERDEDRLRLILSRWELGEIHDDHDVEAGPADDPEAERQRVTRRIAALEERRLLIEAEMADLRTSAIWRLNLKIEEARLQGWDLFAEMIREVQRETQRATQRLASLNRKAAR
jgi:hypothetical protein